MAGERCEHSTGWRQNDSKCSIAHEEEKMNKKELIEDLRAQLQAMEDVKTQIMEAQEDLRQTITLLQMGGDPNGKL